MNKKLLYLSRRDVIDVGLPMIDVLPCLEGVFRDKAEGKLEMPPKPGVHPRGDSSIRAMLAFIPSLDAAGVKWISGYGRNYIAGLPNINGLIILNDTETGVPRVVMDCTWVTAKRTGAAAAISAKHLARRDSKTLGLVACGQLARTNLEAFALQFPLTEVRAYDIDFARARAFEEEVAPKYPFPVKAVKNLRDAVDGLDMVVTAGPIVEKPEPPIPAEWMAPGSFGCALDFDAMFQRAAFSQATTIVTDDMHQLEYFRGTGYFRDTPEPHLDLASLVNSERRKRRLAQSRTMAILLGIGALDIAVGKLVYDRAIAAGIGTELPF